jgi:hypothetical protein
MYYSMVKYNLCIQIKTWLTAPNGMGKGVKQVRTTVFKLQNLEVRTELQMCETWSLILTKDHRLGVFDNMVVEGILLAKYY